MRRIKLMTDYQCWPLWDMDEPDNLDPATLPLSAATRERLERWREAFEAGFNWDDPGSSCWPSHQAYQAFWTEGRSLWKQLGNELGPDCEVYFHDEQGMLLSPAGEPGEGPWPTR